MKKLKTKQIFDEINKLTQKYLLLRGMCKIVLNNEDKYTFKDIDDSIIYESTGNFDSELVLETLKEESGFDVECPGYYKFSAMLYYNCAQVGSYPPPNVEIPAHYELMHIEFDLQIDLEDYEKQAASIINTNLPY